MSHVDSEGSYRLLAKIFENGKTPQFEGKGICASMEPEVVDKLFFGTNANGEQTTGRKRSKEVEKAKAICGRCPLQSECLGHAMEKNMIYGVWGGTSGEEREKERKRVRNTKPLSA